MTEPKLPLDGQLVSFEEVPAGSLLLPKVVYRVEHGPLDREYLLTHVGSGHAARIMPHELMRMEWADAADWKPPEKNEPRPQPID